MKTFTGLAVVVMVLGTPVWAQDLTYQQSAKEIITILEDPALRNELASFSIQSMQRVNDRYTLQAQSTRCTAKVELKSDTPFKVIEKNCTSSALSPNPHAKGRMMAPYDISSRAIKEALGDQKFKTGVIQFIQQKGGGYVVNVN